MTVATTPPLIEYVENGVTLIHAVPFQFEKPQDIRCSRISDGVQTVLTYGLHFTVAGGGGSTGSVTKLNGGVNGTIFRIERRTSRAQAADYITGDDFAAESHEDALDRAQMVNQEQDVATADVEGRALRLPPGETQAALPKASERAGKLLGFAITGVRELLSYSALAGLLAGPIAALLPPMAKGDPGGNIMAIGLFTAAAQHLGGGGIDVPNGADLVQTAGYSANGRGHAVYVADAAVDAAWLAAHPRAGFISSNGRGFRLSLDQQLAVTMFGADPTGVADSLGAFQAAAAFGALYRQTGGLFNEGLPAFRVPFGTYQMSDTLDLEYAARWIGDGGGVVSAPATLLKWNDNATGIRIQANNTSGSAGTKASVPNRGTHSIFEGMVLDGGYVAGGAEAERHGVHMRGSAQLRDLLIQNWAGDGVHQVADTTNPAVLGNANLVIIQNVMAIRCRRGRYSYGADTNAGNIIAFSAMENRQWGIHDGIGLGNTYVGPHCEVNARLPNLDGVNLPACFVSHGGNRYFCIPGQEAWASANAPSGTTANNQGWGYWQAGAADAATGIPAWFNGMLCRAGGGYFLEGAVNSSVLIGPYMEMTEIAILDQSASSFGGTFFDVWRWNAGVLGGRQGAPGGPATLRARFSGLEAGGDFNVFGTLRAPAGSAQFGPSTGAAMANLLFFDTTDTTSQLYFRSWSGGVPQTDGYIISTRNSNLALQHTHQIDLQIDDETIAWVDDDALWIDTGRVLKINATQVLTEQQPAIAAPAGGGTVDAEARTTIGNILVALRTHGLIAT